MPNMFMLTPSVLDLLLIIEFVIYDQSIVRVVIVCLRTSVGMRESFKWSSRGCLSEIPHTTTTDHTLFLPISYYNCAIFRYSWVQNATWRVARDKKRDLLGVFAFGFLLLICLISENKYLYLKINNNNEFRHGKCIFSCAAFFSSL